MSSGHASHKGTSTKPNTNAEGVINTADDAPVDAPEIVTQASTSTRPDEAPENAAATQRPNE
ncbi:MAG TPA: hypothetical protein V6C90_14095 [Coleofasciculaceae cyanobacterium]|jgi:hypothetical protein